VSDAPLTRERILEAAEEVLRRHGPAKATVLDVSRALGVSHGSVYRFFPSKAALREAVTERWLQRISAPLTAIAAQDEPAAVRLRRWLDKLVGMKRKKVRDDPELFAAYQALAAESGDAVRAHVEALVGQLAAILEDGAARGELEARDPAAAARAIFTATGKFHNPVHAAAWRDPGIDAELDAVVALLLRGLGAPPPPRARRR
jgi:AcrR family transcriptional regulator